MLLQQLRGGVHLTLVLLAVSFLPSICEAASPEDSIGTWKLKSVCPDGKTRHCAVTVSREDDKLKGIYTADGKARPAKNIQFERGVLIIVVDGEYGGQTYGLTFRGRPAAGKVKGTARWAYGWLSGSFEFEGERVEEEVAQVP